MKQDRRPNGRKASVMVTLCLYVFAVSPSDAAALIDGYTCTDRDGRLWQFSFVASQAAASVTCEMKGPSKNPAQKEATVNGMTPEECRGTMALMELQGGACEKTETMGLKPRGN